MALTTAQLTTLKAAILADPELAAIPHNTDGHVETARLLNLLASPAFTVWKTAVTWDEIMLNGMDWARCDNLSIGKARIWDWMFQNSNRTMNPSKANIRTGIDATWVGTAADLAVRASVYVHCKRFATRAEKIFATGTGTDASPAVPGWEGVIDMVDINNARNL